MKNLTKISLLLFFVTSICYAQNKPKSYINDMGNSNSNFYTIELQYDSLLRYGQLDGSGEKLGLHFARWKWFWESRIGDAIDQMKSGKFTNYFDALNSLNSSPVCNNSSQYSANWNLLGPIQLPRQEMGRMDAVAMDPNNDLVVYAGAPLSGLWRTLDITAATPVWENITDSEQLPGLGIEDILIDPDNSDVIYLATGLNFTSGYGVGVLKTTDGTSSNPQWDFTDLTYDPFLKDMVRIRKLLMQPSNHNVVYAITDREVFKTTDGGTSWPSFGFYSATNNNDDIDLRNLVFDPLNNSNIIVSGNEVWRWNNSTSQWTDITGNLTSTPTSSIVLAVSGNKIYALYSSKIDISSDGGITWSLHTSTNQKGPLFIVSPANSSIMYIGDGSGRVVYKSTNGGTTFSAITKYNGYENGTFTHADIRGLQLASASQNGLNDVLLAGTDGGILFSTSAVSPSGFPVNWTDATGTGLAVSEFYGLSHSEKVPGRIVAGAQDNGFATYDNNTWVNKIVGDGYEMLFDRENPDIVYGERIGWLGPRFDAGIYFKKSIDGGQSWNLSLQQPPWGNQSNPDNVGYSPDIWNVKSSPIEMDPNNIFTVGFHDLFKYNSSNNSWTPLSDFTDRGVSRGAPCSSFAIAPSNPNIIYFAFENPTWNNTIKKKLWKTSNGGVTWTDVTNNLPVAWAGISGITIDPTDTDRVWVSFFNIWSNPNLTPPYNGVNRVLFSANGGASWSDYSTGLTCLPVNSIVYQKGSDDGLYVGTDVGVFYRNNSMSQWECFNDEFPVAIVTDLEINYCSSKIICSTYGRGVWESDLAETSDIYYEICSGTPETWDVNMFSIGGVKVCSGNTLTITSKIEFTENAKLIIDPGGKLILNGGTLTNACTGLWQGVEVWGNPALSQIPANQGWLSISNGGTIENAVVAVRVGSADYSGMGGGIIHTDEAIFHNNRSGVIMHEYAGNNLGNFNLSTFETTAELVDGTLPDAHIRLLGVEGISITGCTFQNTRDGNTPYSQRGIGILSFDASYYVDHFCISQSMPCTQYQKTVFDSLYYGIEAYAISATKAPSIKNTQFSSNFRGIYLSGITLARVTSNSFYLNGTAASKSYGLYLDGCTRYWVEDNHFEKSSSQTSQTGIGIYVSESGNLANEIYLNSFESVEYAVVALGNNRYNRRPEIGLQIRCNDYNNTLFDEVVVYDGWLAPPTDDGIASLQGANTTNAEDMAGNLFYYNTDVAGDFDDINNQSNHFYYYYSMYAGTLPVEPLDYTTSTVTKVAKTINNWTYEVGCPSGLSPSGGGSTEESRSAMAEAQANIESTEAVLLALVDGGDTETLNTEVQSSTPSETETVYSELMAESPNLSETVVESTIEKETVLPNAMVRDVMVANPHTSTSLQLLDKLDQRTNPMPAFMKAQILTGRSISSLKAELEGQVAMHQIRKAKAMNRIARQFDEMPASSAKTDSLLALYQADNSITSRYMQAWLYMQSGQYLQGQNVMTDIPSDFTLSANEQAEHQNMQSLYTMLSDLHEARKQVNELSAAQQAQLEAMVPAKTGLASIFARNILVATDAMQYSEPVTLPNQMKSASTEEVYKELNNAPIPKILEVYPNPSKDFVVLGYRFNSDNQGVIEIRDASGSLIHSIPFAGMQDQLTVITFSWSPGIYMVSLMVNERVIETTKFTLIN
jgi:hypothetical protein